MTSKIDLYYINLDSATERRASIEESIRSSGFSDRWSFWRFPAIAADSEAVLNTPGRNSNPYKGNFLSHRQCIELSLQSDAHLFIAEDDTMFCRQTGPLVEQLIDSLPEDSWDVIRTDITLVVATDTPKLYKLCVSDKGRKTVRLIDLHNFGPPYVGAGAYIINRRSKKRYFNTLRVAIAQNNGRCDSPYDAYLRDLLQYGILRGFVTVPFLTAPSFHEDASQAPQIYTDKPPSKDEALARFNKVHREMQTAFRRLVWIGYTPDTVLPQGYETGDAVFAMTDQDKLFQKLASWFLMLQHNMEYPTELVVQPSFELNRVPGRA